MEEVLRALAEPHRRQILALVRRGEMSAGEIARRFHVTRSAVSQHLAVLREAGLLSERREGTRRLYRAEPASLSGLHRYLDEFWNARLAGLQREAADGERQGVVRERVCVEKEVAIAADPVRVWELLTDPREATRWMGRSASFDLRVGGRYRVEVLPDLWASGEFLEIDPPRRLVHSWGWELAEPGPVPPGSTVVVYELLGNGESTLLRLSHGNLPSLATAGSHSRGWAHYLARLADAAAGSAVDPDPWAGDPERMREELRPASGAPVPPRPRKE